MSQPKPKHAEVREHYRQLAGEYRGRANPTCEQVYFRLIERFLGHCGRVLEVGAGCSEHLSHLGAKRAVACDLSEEMLRARPPDPKIECVVAAAEKLPFVSREFEGVFSVNLLEHVADIDAVMAESARVLAPGGTWMAITPNGDWKLLLNLAENLKLKLPEGPHQFLTTKRLRESAEAHFEIVEHRTMLSLPMGSVGLASCVDRITFSRHFGWGFFQYLVGKKRA
jgi:ubiquinone/menaquinone biosynthesis C-methylase UbiE